MWILRKSYALLIQAAQSVLRADIVLKGGFSQPYESLLRILGDSCPGDICLGQIVLGDRIPCLSFLSNGVEILILGRKGRCCDHAKCDKPDQWKAGSHKRITLLRQDHRWRPILSRPRSEVNCGCAVQRSPLARTRSQQKRSKSSATIISITRSQTTRLRLPETISNCTPTHWGRTLTGKRLCLSISC